MLGDFTVVLWLLKLGALVNLYFLVSTFALPSGADLQIVAPAQILFGVSAFRCLFPCRYLDNVVLHDSPFSSIFLTRVLATFAEVAYIYQFSHVIRLLNADDVDWVDALSWVMVFQVVVSQGFVWGAILTGRLGLYFWEELGWMVIFSANTLASAHLYASVETLGTGEILLQLNLLFGLFYLPWQVVHLRALRAEARAAGENADAETAEPRTHPSRELLAEGLRRSLHVRKRTTDAAAWGGWVGLTWMVAYWATLIPLWVHVVVRVLSAG
jgi:hypothetical protein